MCRISKSLIFGYINHWEIHGHVLVFFGLSSGFCKPVGVPVTVRKGCMLAFWKAYSNEKEVISVTSPEFCFSQHEEGFEKAVRLSCWEIKQKRSIFGVHNFLWSSWKDLCNLVLFIGGKGMWLWDFYFSRSISPTKNCFSSTTSRGPFLHQPLRFYYFLWTN